MLSRLDEDASVNATLLEFLRAELGISVEGVDPPPEDASGVDVHPAAEDLHRTDVGETPLAQRTDRVLQLVPRADALAQQLHRMSLGDGVSLLVQKSGKNIPAVRGRYCLRRILRKVIPHRIHRDPDIRALKHTGVMETVADADKTLPFSLILSQI